MLRALADEVIYYFKNITEIIVFTYLISVVPLTCRFGTDLDASVSDSLVWASLIIANLHLVHWRVGRWVGTGHAVYDQLLPWPLELVAVSKILAAWLVSSAIVLFAQAALAFFQSASGALPSQWLHLVVANAAITAMHWAMALLKSSMAGRAGMVGLLALPFLIPALIVGANYQPSAAWWQPELGFLAGYSMVMLILASIITAASLRHSH